MQQDHEGESMKEIEEKLQTIEKEKLDLKAEVRDLQKKLKNSNDSITELQSQQIQVSLNILQHVQYAWWSKKKCATPWLPLTFIGVHMCTFFLVIQKP